MFKFEVMEEVILHLIDKKVIVTGRVEFATRQNQYLIYHAVDGKDVEEWRDETKLSKVH